MNNLYNKEFENFTKKNTSFFKNSKNYKNNILVFSITNDLIFNTIVLKFAKAISEIESSNILFMPFVKPNQQIKKLTKSFNIFKIFITYIQFINVLIKYFFTIFFHVLKISNGKILEAYQINNIPLGKHIYDYILIRNKAATIDKISSRFKLDLIFCLVYFFLVRDKIIKYHVKSVMTLDNVYIEGIVFELSKYYKLKLYSGFDINNLTVHSYRTENDYKVHCRTPDIDYIDRLFANPKFKKKSIEFLNKRFSGNQNQHDAKRAFASNKLKLNRSELTKKYQLDDSKIVLVLPHVFCDAPHAYPSVFYQDYQHWLLDTLRVLDNNTNINVLIKEHPSSDLYEEKGYLNNLLNTIKLKNVKLISSNINSKSLMSIVDTIVTCGGTSGMEYAYHGVPVIIASTPPYGNFSFVNRAQNINHYYQLLNNITDLNPPSIEQQANAGNLLYLFFEYYGIDKSKAFLDCYKINRGEQNDLNYFFTYIAKPESLQNSHLFLKEQLSNMIRNNFNNLYKNID